MRPSTAVASPSDRSPFFTKRSRERLMLDRPRDRASLVWSDSTTWERRIASCVLTHSCCGNVRGIEFLIFSEVLLRRLKYLGVPQSGFRRKMSMAFLLTNFIAGDLTILRLAPQRKQLLSCDMVFAVAQAVHFNRSSLLALVQCHCVAMFCQWRSLAQTFQRPYAG